MSSFRPLIDWMRIDPALLAQATHKAAELAGAQWADAADAIQQALVVAWESQLNLRTPLACHRWLYRHAVAALRTGRRNAGRGVAFAPSQSLDALVDSADIVGHAHTIEPERAGALLACLAGETTLEEAGRELDLTKERVRQCRDALAARVKTWAEKTMPCTPQTFAKLLKTSRRRFGSSCGAARTATSPT